jgi:hypothetical protein
MPCSCTTVLLPCIRIDCGHAVHAQGQAVPVVSGLQPQLLTVPPGFNISVYSDGLPGARTMSATVVNGSTIVYVGNGDRTGKVSGAGTVYQQTVAVVGQHHTTCSSNSSSSSSSSYAA